MDLDERTYQLVEQYLNGELKGQELIDFEEKIASIPQLKEVVNINKELLAHFNEGHVVEETDPDLEKMYTAKEVEIFKGKLVATLEEHKKQNPIIKKEATVKKISWKLIAAAVAASILVVVACFYYYNLNSEISSEELFAQHFTQEPLSLTTKGEGEEIISEIEKSYNNQNFVAAEPLLSSMLDSLSIEHPFWFDLQLSQGISLLKLGKNKEAKDIFNTLRKSDSIDAPKGNWYYILTVLKEGKKEKALEEINTYLKDGGIYKATELKEIRKELI